MDNFLTSNETYHIRSDYIYNVLLQGRIILTYLLFIFLSYYSMDF